MISTMFLMFLATVLTITTIFLILLFLEALLQNTFTKMVFL